MKILHDNGKLFGKVSMVDILVVVISIFLFIGLYNRYTNEIMPKQMSDNVSEQQFGYEIRIENVIPETATMIQIGDKVYDKTSGTEIGEVYEVNSEIAKQDFITLSGEIVEREINEKIDIFVKVKTFGSIKDEKYFANQTINILAGENRQFETKYVSLYSKVLDVYKMEE